MMLGVDKHPSPQNGSKTAVFVDAMYMIHRQPFKKDTKFEDIADRYLVGMVNDIPPGTASIHFCCDRYKSPSLKLQTRSHRTGKPSKTFTVADHFTAPEPTEFFKNPDNKARLLSYLCKKWSESDSTHLTLGSLQLYLGGGFDEETKSVLIAAQSQVPVPELESTQEEADTRLILHIVHSVRTEGVNRVIVHANDTDVIVLCIYYAATHLQDLPEFWVRVSPKEYLPIHSLANVLGVNQCKALPMIHSLSGRDTTSFPYFTSKKAWFISSRECPTGSLAEFAEDDDHREMADEICSQARDLTITVYSKKYAMQGCTLSEVRANKFLNNKSTLLKMLPPTKGSFVPHLRRAMYATMIDKSAHIPKPNLPPPTEYGWELINGDYVPVLSVTSLWPEQLSRSISCNCLKGCNRNCSCARKQVPCYIGCKCTGSADRCSHNKCLEEVNVSDSEN